jgi:hypothetical protein
MLDDQAMAEQWIVRVHEKEYGPAEIETLREWRREGRILPSNPARRVNVNSDTAAALAEEVHWTTAAEIPGLFEAKRPPVQLDVVGQEEEPAADVEHHSFASILSQTLTIYRKGFFQFLGLTLLTVLPSVCGQFASLLLQTSPNANADLRNLVIGAFSFGMLVLGLVLWPVYIAGIQIFSADLAAGRGTGFLNMLNMAVKYWPRVAGLCLFVYGVFFLLTVFAFGIAAMVLIGASSLFAIVLALGLLALQVWLFGRFFINVLFWQQFAVLENAGALDSLRESKTLARSGGDQPWFQRPLWRGAFIVSIWAAFVLAIALVHEWPMLRDYFSQLMSTQDPQALLQKWAAAASQTHGIEYSSLGLSLLQRILQPLLGIAFVVLYFDSKQRHDRS